ncbi:MAG: M48 family metalloprotease [Pseudomonadota bacterium]
MSARRNWLAHLGFLLAGGLLVSACNGTVLSTEGLGLGRTTADGRSAAQGPKVSVESVQARDPQSRVGAREHPRILSLYGGVYRNSDVERLVALIVSRLVEQTSETDRAYQITILDSPSVNAFALPGGFIYVTRGLVALANDSSELAAVIAHEMGHVAASHGIKRNERARTAAVRGRVVRDLLSGGDPTRETLDKLSLARFSRNQELEADRLGVELAGKGGFDPYAQARYLRSMQVFSSWKAGGGRRPDGLDFLSTHPSAPRREELARAEAAKVGPPGIGDRDRDRYLQGIDGLTFGDKPEEGFVRGRTYSHPGLAITFTVPEGFRLDNRAEAIVASGPGDKAIRVDAAPLPKGRSLNDYLNSGWIGGLSDQPPVQTQINGLDALRAKASSEGWVFDITLMKSGERVYRLITAAPKATSGEAVTRVGEQVAQSFRGMSREEVAALRPLQIEIARMRSGQTIEALARSRMSWTDDGAGLIRALNGLSPGAQPSPGTRLKLVVER